jgi:hypothetical protein
VNNLWGVLFSGCPKGAFSAQAHTGDLLDGFWEYSGSYRLNLFINPSGHKIPPLKNAKVTSMV